MQSHRFRQAVGRVGEIHRDFRIAGTVVRLSFAGPGLVELFTRSLAQRPFAEAAANRLFVRDLERVRERLRTAPRFCAAGIWL